MRRPHGEYKEPRPRGELGSKSIRASSPLGLPCGVVGKLTNIVSSGFLPAAADPKAGIYVQEL